MNKNEIINLLNIFNKKTEKRINLDKIIFFGSKAKGVENERSDVDLLLISEDLEGKKIF